MQKKIACDSYGPYIHVDFYRLRPSNSKPSQHAVGSDVLFEVIEHPLGVVPVVRTEGGEIWEVHDDAPTDIDMVMGTEGLRTAQSRGKI